MAITALSSSGGGNCRRIKQERHRPSSPSSPSLPLALSAIPLPPPFPPPLTAGNIPVRAQGVEPVLVHRRQALRLRDALRRGGWHDGDDPRPRRHPHPHPGLRPHRCHRRANPGPHHRCRHWATHPRAHRGVDPGPDGGRAYARSCRLDERYDDPFARECYLFEDFRRLAMYTGWGVTRQAAAKMGWDVRCGSAEIRGCVFCFVF